MITKMLEYYRSKEDYKNNYNDASFLNDTKEEVEFKKNCEVAVKQFNINDTVIYNGQTFKILNIYERDIEAVSTVFLKKSGKLKKGALTQWLNPLSIKKIN